MRVYITMYNNTITVISSTKNYFWVRKMKRRKRVYDNVYDFD